MKKQLILCAILLLASPFALATPPSWKCPSGDTLNQLFRQASWKFNSQQQNYLATITYPIDNVNFTAALHTKTSTLDSRDPGLTFSKSQTQVIEHYGITQIQCLYQINSLNLEDMGDGFLYLTGTVPL
jgi:hypothetical protein